MNRRQALPLTSVAALTLLTALVPGAGALLSGCAATAPRPPRVVLPTIRLSPAALGTASYALSQRLTVTLLDQPGARTQQMDVQLQLDASGLLVAGFAFGQRVLLMQWDGESLQVTRHPRLPPEVDTDRTLRDLCLVFWPADTVRAALPEGWRWVDADGRQELRQGDTPWLSVARPAEGLVEIVNTAEGYRLRIESRPLGAS